MLDYTVNEQRAAIWINGVTFQVWRIAEDSYWLCEKEVALLIDEPEDSFLTFFTSLNFRRLPMDCQFGDTRKVVKIMTDDGETPCISLEAAIYYWGERAVCGNDKAFRMLRACITDAIEFRVDSVLAVKSGGV